MRTVSSTRILSLAAWWRSRNSDTSLMASALCALPVAVVGDHRQRMDAADVGRGEARGQIVLAVVVHEEADRAAVHAVDRDAVVHEAVQRLQHVAVAAERHDGVGLGRVALAVARDKALARLDRLRHVARHEGNLLEFSFWLWHGGMA